MDQSAASAIVRRRESDAERKRRQRHGTSRDNVTGQDGTGRDTLPPGFSPTPPFPNPPLSSVSPTAREAVEEKLSAEVEHNIALVVGQCGEHWAALDAFLKRRPCAKWNGWLKAFLTCGVDLGWNHLARACTDDEALERPIASPMGLRGFVASAKRESMAPSPTTGAGPPRRGSRPTPQTYEYGTPTSASQADEWLK
jgi:hypothetical protein